VKKVEVVVDGSKLEQVRAALDRVGVDEMTVIEVRGYERDSGRTELYRGAQHKVFLVTKVKVEIVVEDGRAPALVEELVRVTRTGRIGDGKVLVTPVEDPARLRVVERSKNAL
jgi:nitrogen regulatory protein PII